jgi:hypothetical protein
MIAAAVAVTVAMMVGIGYARGRTFNSDPPRELTWAAEVASAVEHDGLRQGDRCVVRMRTAQRCRRGCYVRGAVQARCGEQLLLQYGPRGDLDRWAEVAVGPGRRMLWDRAAGTLVLEWSATLEPARVSLRLDDQPDVRVNTDCRARFVDALSLDSTPDCAYRFLDDWVGSPQP